MAPGRASLISFAVIYTFARVTRQFIYKHAGKRIQNKMSWLKPHIKNTHQTKHFVSHDALEWTSNTVRSIVELNYDSILLSFMVT